MNNNLDYLKAKLKEIEKLKANLKTSLDEVDEIKNPEEYLKNLGYDLSDLKNLSPEELSKKFSGLNDINDELKKAADIFDSSSLNKKNSDSKSIENYFKKIAKQDGKFHEIDLEKLSGFYSKYLKSETENIGQSCFHFDKEKCNYIIDAHSLQKNGPLKNISSDSHEVIHIKKDTLKGSRKPSLIKTVNASTFKGFCHNHDSIFQKSIESFPFSASSKDNFLHSYRSFAFSHHMVKQEQDYSTSFVENMTNGLSNIMDSLTDLYGFFGGNTSVPVHSVKALNLTEDQKKILSITRYESYKNDLNVILKSEDYDELDYFVYSKKHMIPIACSSWVKTHLNFGDGLVIQHDGNYYNGYPIMVTVIPESTENSTVILARFKSDKISEVLFNQFRELEKISVIDLELVLSSLILRFVENLYLSPDWWFSLDSFLTESFYKEMDLWNSNFMKIKPTQTVINLFDDIYKLENTKT